MTSNLKPDLRVQFCGIELRNPVIAASGTFGYGVEFEDIVSLKTIGAFVTKGLSREPMAGNPPPRIIETAAGMLNAIGLQNMGVTAFIEQKLESVQKLPCPAIANVFGGCIDDYCAVMQALNAVDGIAAYELNASCPNTQHGGMVFGTDASSLHELVVRAKSIARRPLIASPRWRALRPTRVPMRFPWSTHFWEFLSTPRRDGLASPILPAAFRGRPSSRWLFAWCTKPRARFLFLCWGWAGLQRRKT
jgi:hypothetical protein